MDKLISLGEIQNGSDLIVELKCEYDTIHLLLSNVMESSDEISDVVSVCK